MSFEAWSCLPRFTLAPTLAAAGQSLPFTAVQPRQARQETAQSLPITTPLSPPVGRQLREVRQTPGDFSLHPAGKEEASVYTSFKKSKNC